MLCRVTKTTGASSNANAFALFRSQIRIFYVAALLLRSFLSRTGCRFCYRGDPQAYLEYMHLAHVFAAPGRFIATVRSSFEEHYNIAPYETSRSYGKRHSRVPHDVSRANPAETC